MESFISFIFWAILIIYTLRLVFRYLFPWLLARFVKKMAKNMQQRGHQNYPPQQREGSVNINFKAKDEAKIDPNIGEYVDFEEIKDNKNSKSNE